MEEHKDDHKISITYCVELCLAPDPQQEDPFFLSHITAISFLLFSSVHSLSLSFFSSFSTSLPGICTAGVAERCVCVCGGLRVSVCLDAITIQIIYQLPYLLIYTAMDQLLIE